SMAGGNVGGRNRPFLKQTPILLAERHTTRHVRLIEAWVEKAKAAGKGLLFATRKTDPVSGRCRTDATNSAELPSKRSFAPLEYASTWAAPLFRSVPHFKQPTNCDLSQSYQIPLLFDYKVGDC